MKLRKTVGLIRHLLNSPMNERPRVFAYSLDAFADHPKGRLLDMLLAKILNDDEETSAQIAATLRSRQHLTDPEIKTELIKRLRTKVRLKSQRAKQEMKARKQRASR